MCLALVAARSKHLPNYGRRIRSNKPPLKKFITETNRINACPKIVGVINSRKIAQKDATVDLTVYECLKNKKMDENLKEFLLRDVSPVIVRPPLRSKYRRGVIQNESKDYLIFSYNDDHFLDNGSTYHCSLNRCPGRNKGTNDKLSEMYDPKYRVAHIQVFKEPVVTFSQDKRLRKLWSDLGCGNEFSLANVKKLFFDVNVVLTKNNWFSNYENWKSQYFIEFMTSDIELPHVWKPNPSRSTRKTDNLLLILRSYKLLISVFCGPDKKKTNRICQYVTDWEKLSSGSHLVNQRKRVRKRKPNKLDKRTTQSDFVAQMLGASAIFSGVAKSAIDSAQPGIVDGIWSVMEGFVKSIPSKLTEMLQNTYSEGAKAMSIICDWLYEQFNSLMAIIKNVLTGVCEIIVEHKVLFCVSLFLFLIMFYIHKQSIGRIYSFLGFALHKLSLRNGYKPADISSYLKPWESEKFQAQIGGGFVPLLGAAVSIVFALTDKNALLGANGVVNFVSRLPVAFNSLEEGIKDCIDFVYHKASGNHLFDSRTRLDEFKSFIDDYSLISEEADLERRVMQDFTYTKKLENLYNRQKHIRNYVHLLKLDAPLSQALAKAMSRVDLLYQKARKHADYYKTRIETPLLWLKGDSGQGKTSVYPHIVAGVYKRVQSAEPDLFDAPFSLGMIHSRDKTSDFWEGYNQHFCCVWNEVFEKLEQSERAKTATELLTACEDGTYPLNMAFEQKGQAFFNSYLGVVTCNLSDDDIKKTGMTFPQALVRRQTLNLEVVRKAVFTIDKPNFDEAWDFVLYYPTDPIFAASFDLGVPEPFLSEAKTKGGVVLSFSQVVTCLSEEILLRLSNRSDKAKLLRTFDYCKYVDRDKISTTTDLFAPYVNRRPKPAVPISKKPPVPKKRPQKKFVAQMFGFGSLWNEFDDVVDSVNDSLEKVSDVSTSFLAGVKGGFADNYSSSINLDKYFRWYEKPSSVTRDILSVDKEDRFTSGIIRMLECREWPLGQLVLRRMDSMLWNEDFEIRRKLFRALKFWSFTLTGSHYVVTVALETMALLLDLPFCDLLSFHSESFEHLAFFIPKLSANYHEFHDFKNPLIRSIVCRVFFHELPDTSLTFVDECHCKVLSFMKVTTVPFPGKEEYSTLKRSMPSLGNSEDNSWAHSGIKLRNMWTKFYDVISENWVTFSYFAAMIAGVVVLAAGTCFVKVRETVVKDEGIKLWYISENEMHNLDVATHTCSFCSAKAFVAGLVPDETFYCPAHTPSWYSPCDHSVNDLFPGFLTFDQEEDIEGYENRDRRMFGVKTQSLGHGNSSRMPGKVSVNPQSLGFGNHSRMPGRVGVTPQSLGQGNQSRMPSSRPFEAHLHTDGLVDFSLTSVSSNFRDLEFHYSNNEQVHVVRCLFSGRRAITIGHFFDVYGLGFSRVAIKNGTSTIHVFSSNEVSVSSLGKGRDLWAVDFPSHMNALSSIKSKFYASREDMLKNMSLSTQFERLHRTYREGQTIIQTMPAYRTVLAENSVNEASNLTTSYFLQGHYIMMGTYGNAGDCGLPYFHRDDSQALKLVGLHVGVGGEANGYCSPVFASDFDSFNAQCAEIPSWLEFESSKEKTFTHDKQLVYMGVLKKPCFIPSVTDIIASPAQGNADLPPLYPITTAPAVLSPTRWDNGVTVKPLDNALNKLNEARVRPLPEWIKNVCKVDNELLTEGFFPKGMDSTKIVPWTIHEVLFGKSGTTWTGMRKDSSVGPDVKRFIPEITSREQLWGIVDEKQWIHPKLISMVVAICSIVKRGNCPKNVVEGCLKDETRSLERVLSGKTRLFCVGSLSHLIWTVMWMGGLVNEMKKHRDRSDVSIGTNVHGFDWKLLYNNLTSLEDCKFGAGDVSGMDTSERSWWGWLLGESCVRFYNFPPGSYEYNSIKMACESALCPVLLIGKLAYWMDFFNSSGGWLTGFLNSFVSVVAFNCVIFIVQHLNRHDEVFSSLKIREFLRRAFYGDDNMWAILSKYSKYLNMQILAKYYIDIFGIEYTTPGKKEIDEPFLEFDSIDYLSRRFRVSGSSVFAPLSLDSIHSMLLWIKKPKTQIVNGLRIKLTIEQQWLMNVETACQEWFHHGKEFFEEEVAKTMEYVRFLGLPWPGKTYEEYLFRWSNGIQSLGSV